MSDVRRHSEARVLPFILAAVVATIALSGAYFWLNLRKSPAGETAWWRTQSNANRSPNPECPPNWEKYWEKRTNCRDSHRENQKTPVAWALLRILSSKNKWERDSRKWEARRNKWEDSQYLNVPANDRANASATLRANRVERPLAANKVILL